MKYDAGQRMVVAIGLVVFGLVGCGQSNNSSASKAPSKASAQTQVVPADSDEHVVRFTIASRDEIHQLTRVVSIDRVDDNVVVAYATADQLAQLRALGYRWEELQHPGINPGANMGLGTRAATTWNLFPTYQDYVAMMQKWAQSYPNICRLYNIGHTTNTKRPHDIWALKISKNPDVAEDEPEVLYTSTMHGDETTGYNMMLRLIDEFLKGYGTDPEVTAMVDSMEIWINPDANPDGTYYSGDNTVSGSIRGYVSPSGSSSGTDPNRNFPEMADDITQPSSARWLETQEWMDFLGAHNFVLSANFHGGAEVMNYPWDSQQRLHPDDEWFHQVSRQWADQAHLDGPSGYMTELDNGVTNGYAWYEVDGGRQDFVTYFQGGREITIELSSTKNPAASTLGTFWQANHKAFHDYLKHALTGIRGIVTDPDGKPVAARIELVDHDTDLDHSAVRTDPLVGDYHRMVLPGTYTVRVSADGFNSQDVSGVVVVASSDATRVDVVLEPIAGIMTLRGHIYAKDGTALTGAKIEVVGTPFKATSAADGAYAIANIGAGTYSLRIMAQGYSVLEAERAIEDGVAADFVLAPVVAMLSTDFEASNGGFVASGSPAPGWQWGAVAGTHSGSKGWATSLGATYADNASWKLDMSVTLPAGHPGLRFWHSYDTEANYDGGNVQVAGNGSSSFVVVTPINGYRGNVSSLGGAGFSGKSSGWVQDTIDLSAYAGQRVTIRWAFASDGSVNARGWLIDDVAVTN
jgi:hypothetical protein